MGPVASLIGGSGSSKGSSSQTNVNNGMLTGALSPAVGATGQATNMMGQVLNGGPGGYADSGGYNFLLNKGMDSVNSNMAARGLGQSGADMKGLADYQHGLASTYLDQYLNHVNQMGNMGLGAAGVLADSGRQSQSKDKSKHGLGGIF